MEEEALKRRISEIHERDRLKIIGITQHELAEVILEAKEGKMRD